MERFLIANKNVYKISKEIDKKELRLVETSTSILNVELDCSRPLRSKIDHQNEGVYCQAINITLKI